MSYNDFKNAYIEAMLWADMPEDLEGHETDASDFSAEMAETVEADCRAFYNAHNALFTNENYKGSHDVVVIAGHDFWLTRQGHGAGFWDGDWKEPAASTLTKAAKLHGECWLEMGDDGKLYIH